MERLHEKPNVLVHIISYFLGPPSGISGSEERNAWYIVKLRYESFTWLYQPGWRPLYRERISTLVNTIVRSGIDESVRMESDHVFNGRFQVRKTMRNLPRRVASSNKPTSTSDRGSMTYRTTLPRMNIFFTDDRWGYLTRSRTSMSSSLILRYWSTDLRVPRMRISFFSSMVTVWLVRVLKKLRERQLAFFPVNSRTVSYLKKSMVALDERARALEGER